MTSIPSSKRPASSATTVKLLITAASVAAVLEGWAMFSSQPTTTSANPSQSFETSLNLAPIPTLVPRPAGRRQTFRAPSGGQPEKPQANPPALRSVSAPPPAPVTTTRSSR